MQWCRCLPQSPQRWTGRQTHREQIVSEYVHLHARHRLVVYVYDHGNDGAFERSVLSISVMLLSLLGTVLRSGLAHARSIRTARRPQIYLCLIVQIGQKLFHLQNWRCVNIVMRNRGNILQHLYWEHTNNISRKCTSLHTGL